MATQNKTTPGPVASLNALEAGYAEAAEHQRHKSARVYLAVLNDHAAETTGAPGIVAALEGEVSGLAACDAVVRAACEAVLDKYPKPKPTTPRIIAVEVDALRSMAQGALNALDHNPALLEHWKTKITEIPDTAERALAEAHWLSIWPLFGQARALAATPEALDAQVRFIEKLVADHPAQGVAVEVSRGSGPLVESLETSRAPRSYKARGAVSHDD